MPYIPMSSRKSLIDGRIPESAGELNFQLTHLIQRYIVDRMKEGKSSYQDINDVMGALEGCKLEFYRRFAAIYEDTKIAENGDVY